ncbi:hypothetical protein A3F65_00785 [Candidatus Saccharibacteria bacterium RIFCSPHIGHO2_12_FULL_47_16b]|nr:MAG: hypothetical protein A3F65_00785 [Candidatus Saccharibacteria bacterium RIFCSPHIGHO2_12_FULL_47_16b]
MDSKVFIVGAKGQLGTALRQKYPNAKSADIDELDITKKESVLGYDWSDVKYILNAAAYTNVDGAETAEGRVAAWQVNAVAVGYLAQVARDRDITLVHISTDYAFDGTKVPHKEDEPLSPLSVYGASKAAGDIVLAQAPKHYLLMTSWVIGEGKNFVRTMLELGQKDVDPTVVADQIGRPTFTTELVRAIDHLLTAKAEFGTYNISNGGEPVSWADLTREIFKTAELERKVTEVTTVEYYKGKANIAPRPLNSTFDLAKIEATGFRPKDWREDLKEYIKKELSR